LYEYRRSYVGDGKKLKEILDSKGTNIRQIAKATRISATTLYSIIQKNSNIRFNFALRLANELEINMNDPWYETNAYSSSATLQSKMNTISSAYSELSKSRSEYVQFYMKNHEQIPTWIMIKVVNFSTFIDVLHNSKTNVTNAICKLYSMYDDNNLPNVKLLIGSLHWLRRVRNSCAHNERVYCIHQTQARNNSASGRILDPYYTQLPTSYSRCTEKNIFDILVYFKYFLPTEEFTPMIIELKNMLIELQNTLQTNAFDNVRGQMGIKNLNVLDALIALPKSKIEYHKFDTL
jgi:abortive infection bacteriophage resistance protein